MTFYDQYQKDLKREIVLKNHHNANNALYLARLKLPLKMCIQASFTYETQVPNQVGFTKFDSATQVGLQI